MIASCRNCWNFVSDEGFCRDSDYDCGFRPVDPKDTSCYFWIKEQDDE